MFQKKGNSLWLRVGRGEGGGECGGGKGGGGGGE